MQESDLLLDELSDCSSGSIEVCCDDLLPGKTDTQCLQLRYIDLDAHFLSQSSSEQILWSRSQLASGYKEAEEDTWHVWIPTFWQPDAVTVTVINGVSRICRQPTLGFICGT